MLRFQEPCLSALPRVPHNDIEIAARQNDNVLVEDGLVLERNSLRRQVDAVDLNKKLKTLRRLFYKPSQRFDCSVAGQHLVYAAAPSGLSPRFGQLNVVDGGLKFVMLRTNREAPVISKAEEYRAKARECEEGAQQTRDSFIKEQFIEVAKKWRDMAAYEEKHRR